MAIFNSYVKLPEGNPIALRCIQLGTEVLRTEGQAWAGTRASCYVGCLGMTTACFSARDTFHAISNKPQRQKKGQLPDPLSEGPWILRDVRRNCGWRGWTRAVTLPIGSRHSGTFERVPLMSFARQSTILGLTWFLRIAFSATVQSFHMSA